MGSDTLQQPRRGQINFCLGLMAAIGLSSLCVSLAGAQDPPQAAAGDEGMVQLTFPPETELRVLIDYVSQRLGVRFLYDEQVANKRISIRTSGPIPTDSLLNVLESALKMKGMALVEAEVKGWKRIVMADDLAQIAVQNQNEPLKDLPGATPLTQAFLLTHITPERMAQIITPFLTKQGANTVSLVDQGMLIVTDYAENIRRVAKLIEVIDQAGPERLLRFYQARHVDAATLSQQISQSLASQAPPQEAGTRPAELTFDARTNQVMIVGTLKQAEVALRLAQSLDVDLGQRTEVYAFQYIEADRIDKFVRELIDPVTVKRLYRSAIDKNDNLLIVTGTEAIHERIRWLRAEMDLETKRPGSAVRFYRVKYANAQDILNTLRAIEQQGGQASPIDYRRGVSSLGRGGVGPPRELSPGESPIEFVPGPNAPATPGEPAPPPPALMTPADGPPPSAPAEGEAIVPGSIVPGAARISVDPNTNSIIIIADRTVQQMYEDLIRTLDRRRPQVMIEAKVVILDTSDDYQLGVELSGGDRTGTKKLLQLTSYGLSAVNPVTGSLALVPGRGFNWTLVDPQNADAIIRAVSSHRRAKVLSSPRIVVNDNATGVLASVTEVPFTSVNASNTVATTSFAGFAEAGTTIEATPRIADEDYLQLDFNISLNSFTGQGSNGVPPPRQTDQVVSSATIPDGYTVIVGGLTRRNEAKSQEGIPFIDRIPVLAFLTSIRTSTKSQTTMFVFLRPVILRDDKFRELKYLSDRDLHRATECRNYPSSAPLLIE